MSDAMGSPERERFRLLYQGTYPAVHAYVSRRIGAVEAPDVTAEVFATAWRRLDRIPEPPLPWLYNVAANHLAHHRRGAARRLRLVARSQSTAPAPVADPSEDVCARVDDAVVVRALLAQLPEPDAEVLRLWAWEGLEPAGIAAALGCSPGAARVRLHRAKARMTALLNEHPAPVIEEIR
jgi:RNA polymerase sigma-70 factor (ECF subfamily)